MERKMSSLDSIKDEASLSVINFLRANVPKNDIPNIESELKKDFLLAKKRTKKLNKKPKCKKSQTLTRREKKSIGFYAIPRTSMKYNDMIALNQIWLEYITHVLDLDKYTPDCTSKTWEQFTQSLYKADFQGSMLEVVRSKCPSYVGKKGICIMDTKNTFKIVSIDNIVTTIPKKDSVFSIHIKNLKISVFGKHLCVRPAERSTKKVKCYMYPDL